MLNHFNFKKIPDKGILITNDFGRYAFLDDNEFSLLVNGQYKNDAELFKKLKDNRFVLEVSDLYSDKVSQDLRSLKEYLFDATSLHILVLTTSCNLRCIYCQAQDEANRKRGVMDEETALKSVDIALQSPDSSITIEFQGGEPLLNFDVIKAVVQYCEENKGNKDVCYTLVSNLSLLDEEKIRFFEQYDVNICTSLDGPKELHNLNRPAINGSSSYDMMLAGVDLLRKHGFPFSAIQTTTRYSLSFPREIVRQYHDLGANGIFLRPLTPLGFAKNEWESIGYSADEWLDFYKTAFNEVLKINLEGICFPEQHACYFLEKILNGRSMNYMELRSPCGAGIGQLAYYCDGNIYTCDEARMISETGNQAFKLGNVYENTYQDLMRSPVCRSVCSASILEGIPGCCDCVYQPYCGVCPVINYALEGDIFPRHLQGYRVTRK